jgi:protein SCO1/2
MIPLALALAAMLQADIDEHPGAPLPLELAFTDQDGRAAHLADSFHDGKPVLLVFAYFRCPMLCDLVLRGVVDAVAAQGLVLGRDFRALTVSIDPRDTPRAASLKQHNLLQAMNQPDAAPAWPFLVGAAPAVHQLAARAGWIYAYDPSTDQYAHPAGAIVLTPDGRIARYLYGIHFRPLDLRLALDEASQGRTVGIVDRVLLTCFHYDPASRRYAWAVRGLLRACAGFTLMALSCGFLLLLRRRRDA